MRQTIDFVWSAIVEVCVTTFDTVKWLFESLFLGKSPSTIIEGEDMATYTSAMWNGSTTTDLYAVGSTSSTTTTNTQNTQLRYVHAFDDISPDPINALLDEVNKLRRLIQVPTPLTKCAWCGQWGAAYCECKHCGHPIDPAPARIELQFT